MRRLLGLKKTNSTPSPEEETTKRSPPQPQSNHPSPATATTAKQEGDARETVGLGISVSTDSVNKAQSRHIAFESPQRPSFSKPAAAGAGGGGASTPAAPSSYSRTPSLQNRSNSNLDHDTHSFTSERRGGGRIIGVGADLGGAHGLMERTTSPLSVAPSFTSYLNNNRSDDGSICAPLTWGDMANAELVVNVSARERTRQEVLWECVASEERYVLELRSFVNLYVTPLLHPLLTSPTVSSPTSSPPPIFSSPTPSTRSEKELPIAARFLKSIGASTHEYDAPLDRRDQELPEIPGGGSAGGGSSESSHHGINRSRNSLPSVSAAQSPLLYLGSMSSASLVPASSYYGRPSLPPTPPSSASPKYRHPLRPAPSSSKLLKQFSRAPPDVLAPPPLPDALRRVLEVIPEMLRGHEELALKLKERWTKDFPLVRGLAEIWSDQPWFLGVYTRFILDLEEALAVLDYCLPSAHSPNVPFSARSKPKTQTDKEEKRLARLIMSLEERAADEGESGLAICISKPLMRLSKLPLLVQNLLYHTDSAAGHEYEKTRAMALEIDALVRSIENDKLEEEERERVRDVFARLEGLNDKALMAPRSARTLIEEIPLWKPPPGSLVPSASPTIMRRTLSDIASRSASVAQSIKSPSPSPSTPTPKPTKRLSDFVHRTDKPPSVGSKNGEANESTWIDLWLVVFSDVTIRCQRTGLTEIPGSFSRDKEKQGKQGQTKRKGRLRNLYRFVKVEQWEMRAMSAAVVDMEEINRVRTADGTLEEESEEDGEDVMRDTDSRMSFSYDNDDPTPVGKPRNFKTTDTIPKPSSSNTSSRAGLRSASSNSTSAVLAKQTPAKSKYGNRMRVSDVNSPPPSQRSPTPSSGRPRYDSPTASSQQKVQQPKSSTGPASAGLGLHSRDDSTLALYERFWGGNEPVPFPSSTPV